MYKNIVFDFGGVMFYRSGRNGYHGIGDEQPSFCRSAV